MSINETLKQAIIAADLPGIIAMRYPKSKAISGKAGRVCCSWRSESKDANGNIYRGRDGRWLFHDFVENSSYDAFKFCTEILRMPASSAASYLKQLTGFGNFPNEPTATRKRPTNLVTVPDFPEELRSWQRVRKLFNDSIRLPSNGVESEALFSLGDWISGTLEPIKERMNARASGLRLEHCIKEFVDDTNFVCPCCKRWLSCIRFQSREESSNHLCSRDEYGCEECGGLWSLSELTDKHLLETRRQVPALRPLKVYLQKLKRRRGH